MIKKLVKNRFILLFDIFSIVIARMLTSIMLFPEMELPEGALIYTGGTYIAIVVLANFIFRMYKIAWQYSGTEELARFIGVGIISALFQLGVNELLVLFKIIPEPLRRVNGGIAVISILIMILVRLFVKEIYKTVSLKTVSKASGIGGGKNRVLIIGAGDAARIIVGSYGGNYSSPYEIVGFIDDDASKQGKILYGHKVLGGREDIVSICENMDVDSIIMAIPSAYVQDRLDILRICNLTKCKVKTIPNICDLLDLENNLSVRDVKIEDLLERDPIILDNEGITDLVKGKIVMVSGGGGSIGSELCRQIMRFSPQRLVILDIYENNAYDIQMELNIKYPGNQPAVLIASIRDRERLKEIFNEYKPDIVFHAAAHKHVPLMETSPGEAIKNNVFGTYNLAMTAHEYGVEKFVMISTDKAVNPTNIMGASKRLCEMIIQCMEKISETDFVAVRFGNVLGSNGSVIPLFERQIASGGPVRVTHKDVTRFFMTIPEAAQLVIQAACYAKGGEIFVLDMGKPVKIYDLAENLIRLSGYIPNVDIKIEVVGLRPGEKLYEELLMDQEGLEGTKHNKIFVGRPMTIDMPVLEEKLKLLKEAVDSQDNNKIRDIMEEVVPTYIRDNVKFNKAHLKTEREEKASV
ncbi:MAG: polysaccharide biosynthesis protein [Clostridia bacterium]|nr:polysaccharide biosynthesis protein [Clostridia bacterium]